MRVVKFSLKLLAIPLLLTVLAVQWALTFVVSLSGWIFHLLSGIIFATAILSGLMELCPWQEPGSMLLVSFCLFLLPHLARRPGDPVGGRGACAARVYKIVITYTNQPPCLKGRLVVCVMWKRSYLSL